jgi:hypothetical protein
MFVKDLINFFSCCLELEPTQSQITSKLIEIIDFSNMYTF